MSEKKVYFNKPQLNFSARAAVRPIAHRFSLTFRLVDDERHSLIIFCIFVTVKS